jgi:DNA-binding transcriptional ArsR family regulator
MMDDEFAGWAVRALTALAHESRLQVHRLLVQAGEGGLSAGAIADQLGIPASSLSFHLSHMQAAEMVNQRREGRSLIYTVNFACMDELMAYLHENCCRGVTPLPACAKPVRSRRRPGADTMPSASAPDRSGASR